MCFHATTFGFLQINRKFGLANIKFGIPLKNSTQTEIICTTGKSAREINHSS